MKRAARANIVLTAVAVVVVCGGMLRADSVTSGERTWNGAKIQQIQDSKLRFTDQNGAQQAVLIPTVTRLQVDLREDLNRAEDLRAQGKSEEAAKAYEAALRTENRNDLASIIRWRLMDIYGKNGQLDRAVEMYVELAKQPDFLMVVKDWRPGNVAGARQKARDSAVAMLDDALRQTRIGLASEYIRQVREFIVSGKAGLDTQAAAASASEVAGEGPASQGEQGTWRTQVLRMLRRGEYSKALESANKVLAAETMMREQLEDALFVRGVALWGVAKDRDRQLQAGWALARVLVEFPQSEYVPECQYYLGLVHAGLGRPDLAKELLQQAQRSPAAAADVKEKAKKAYLDLVVKPN